MKRTLTESLNWKRVQAIGEKSSSLDFDKKYMDKIFDDSDNTYLDYFFEKKSTRFPNYAADISRNEQAFQRYCKTNNIREGMV